MSLNKELGLLHKDVIASLPEDVRELLIEENRKLFSAFMEKQALNAGSQVPDVFFRDKDLQPVYLKDLLKKHHVVLSFYRGTWCPYCNLELQALSKINDEIEEKGARLISVSPEIYEVAKESIAQKGITIPIFTDLANHAAEKFGLVFSLPPQYREIYKILNIHLNVLNDDDSWTLPMPATFIISKEGLITSTYVNADYTKRMEPDDILENLDELNA